MWLWQMGWVLVVSGILCAVLAALIRPLRRRWKGTWVACVAAVCLLLTVLCVHPVVVYDGSVEEKAQIRQLAAGPYSNRIPAIPVCAVAEEILGSLEVKVWYAFAGNMTYFITSDGVISIVDPLFMW